MRRRERDEDDVLRKRTTGGRKEPGIQKIYTIREEEKKRGKREYWRFDGYIVFTSLSDEDGALLFPSSANFSRSFQKLKLIDYKVTFTN